MTLHEASIAIAVDSAADIPAELAARWKITVIPAFINFGPESYPDDGVAMPRSEFYRRLAEASTMPTTSAMPPGLAVEAYRKILERAERLLVFSVAGSLSSIYNTLALAAAQVSPERIIVVDTHSASMGTGYQALAAAEALARGATLDEAIAAAAEVRPRTEIWAVASTLEYLRRGGRVSTVLAGIGTLLQIKPIISLKDGVVSIPQRARTMNRAVETVREWVRACAPLDRLSILHADNRQGAAAFLNSLRDIAPADTSFADVNTGIGVHIGPGALGAILVRAKQG